MSVIQRIDTSSYYRHFTTDYRLFTTDTLLQTLYYRLFTTDYRLFTTDTFLVLSSVSVIQRIDLALIDMSGRCGDGGDREGKKADQGN